MTAYCDLGPSISCYEMLPFRPFIDYQNDNDCLIEYTAHVGPLTGSAFLSEIKKSKKPCLIGTILSFLLPGIISRRTTSKQVLPKENNPRRLQILHRPSLHRIPRQRTLRRGLIHMPQLPPLHGRRGRNKLRRRVGKACLLSCELP